MSWMDWAVVGMLVLYLLVVVLHERDNVRRAGRQRNEIEAEYADLQEWMEK